MSPIRKENEPSSINMMDIGKDFTETAKTKSKMLSLSQNTMQSSKEVLSQLLKPVTTIVKNKNLQHYRSYSNVNSPNASTTTSTYVRPLVIGAPHLERMEKGLITKPRKMRQQPVDIKFRTGDSMRLLNHFSIIKSNQHVIDLTSPVTSLEVHRQKANIFTQFGQEQFKQKFQVKSKVDSGIYEQQLLSNRSPRNISSGFIKKKSISGNPSQRHFDLNYDSKTYDTNKNIFKQL